jgi:hypothetical protein
MVPVTFTGTINKGLPLVLSVRFVLCVNLGHSLC